MQNLKQSQLFERGGAYGINWWRIAKSKLSNELERGGINIYGMTYETYIDRGGCRLTSVGLAQARPNNIIVNMFHQMLMLNNKIHNYVLLL